LKGSFKRAQHLIFTLSRNQLKPAVLGLLLAWAALTLKVDMRCSRETVAAFAKPHGTPAKKEGSIAHVQRSVSSWACSTDVKKQGRRMVHWLHLLLAVLTAGRCVSALRTALWLAKQCRYFDA
jgi:hypothetical protein